jgi:striatin 1/3/4
MLMTRYVSHLDAVRAVAFHPSELCLATGGDDCTVKIWRMEVSNLASSSCVLLY